MSEAKTVIRYKEGYKYQLVKDAVYQTTIWQQQMLKTEWIELWPSGTLYIKAGYCWDGASGPAIDTKAAVYGSCCHDALYQLMRLGLLPQSFREQADEEYRKKCIEGGMWRVRAWVHFDVLRLFGGPAADPGAEPRVLTAP